MRLRLFFFFLFFCTIRSSWANRPIAFDWLIDSTHVFDNTNISSVIFKAYRPSHTPLNKTYNYWIRTTLHNSSAYDETFLLTFPTKWGYITAFTPTDSIRSGSLLPLSQRSVSSYGNVLKLKLKTHSHQTVYIRLRGGLSIFVPDQLEIHQQSLENFYKNDATRLWTQGIFFGIILIMGLYNFVIYLSVRDISYLFYTLSILSIGSYFIFYYGFGIEYFWPNSPLWDAYSYAFIIPITNWARLYFTKTYLHLADYSPRLNNFLTLLAWVCVITFGISALCFFAHFDVLDLLVDWIGFLGTTVLSLMFIVGLWVSQKGYSPAKYFSVANSILVLGGILFIFKEMGLMNDNLLTRYAVQIGVIAQVVLFSLGLSSRLNRTQMQLAQLELNKEREKKELIEEQRLLLIEKVKEQTTHLRELNQLKDKLLSIISHDLRNPLVSLNSFLNLLIHHQDKLEKKEQLKLAEKARQSLDNLDQLLTNLLYWSRSQMNLLRLNRTPVELSQLIEQALQFLALEAELKSIQLLFSPKIEVKLYLDNEMIAFVFRNLLGNAIKFSHLGSQVTIGIFRPDPHFIEIIIVDKGIGMSQEQIRHLGTSHALTSTRGTAKEKGSGLGLVLCQEFVELHRGKLLIESQKDRGTTVTVRFPIEPIIA